LAWRSPRRLSAGQAHAEELKGQELTGTLKKVKETGVINIGYRDSSIPFSLSGRHPEADRLCDRHLPQNRRRREGRTQARQARGRIQSGDVIDPAFRCWPTVPSTWNVARPPTHPERLKQVAFTNTHFLTRDPLRVEEVGQSPFDRRSQGQDGGLHRRHHPTSSSSPRPMPRGNLNLNIVPARSMPNRS